MPRVKGGPVHARKRKRVLKRASGFANSPGTQYRSAIFYHSPEQEQAARASKQELEKSHRFSRPIVSQILPAVTFYEAEDYHQQYLEKRGLATCQIK